MKIAVFTLNLLTRGGQTRFLLELANHWSGSGVTVDIYTGGYDPNACFSEHDQKSNIIPLPIAQLNLPRRRKLFVSLSGQLAPLYSFNPRTKFKLIPNFITHALYDLAIENSRNSNHAYDAVFAIGYAGDAWAASRFSEHYDLPLIWHTLDPLVVIRNRERVRQTFASRFGDWVYTILEKQHMRRATKIVSCDLSYEDYIREHYGKTPIPVGAPITESFFTAPKAKLSGITARFRAAGISIPSSAFKALSVCIAFSHRRIEDLIHAYHTLRSERPAYLYVSMPDQYHTGYTKKIQSLVAKRGLQTQVLVEDRFPANDDELVSWYDEANAFIFPGYPQTWGISPTEAMARACPTIVTDGVGMHSIIETGVSGYIYPRGNVSALTDILRRLISNPENTSILGNNARDAVVKYRADLFAQRYLEIIEKAIREYRRP